MTFFSLLERKVGNEPFFKNIAKRKIPSGRKIREIELIGMEIKKKSMKIKFRVRSTTKKSYFVEIYSIDVSSHKTPDFEERYYGNSNNTAWFILIKRKKDEIHFWSCECYCGSITMGLKIPYTGYVVCGKVGGKTFNKMYKEEKINDLFYRKYNSNWILYKGGSLSPFPTKVKPDKGYYLHPSNPYYNERMESLARIKK